MVLTKIGNKKKSLYKKHTKLSSVTSTSKVKGLKIGKYKDEDKLKIYNYCKIFHLMLNFWFHFGSYFTLVLYIFQYDSHNFIMNYIV